MTIFVTLASQKVTNYENDFGVKCDEGRRENFLLINFNYTYVCSNALRTKFSDNKEEKFTWFVELSSFFLRKVFIG